MEHASTAPRLNDIIRQVIAALKAGEIILPAIADDLPGIQAFPVEGGPVPGLGIVGDGRGLRILVLTVEEARGTAEYVSQRENFLALFRSLDDKGTGAAVAGEVLLEEVSSMSSSTTPTKRRPWACSSGATCSPS